MKNNELVLQSYKYLYTKVRKYPRNTKKMRTMYDRAEWVRDFGRLTKIYLLQSREKNTIPKSLLQRSGDLKYHRLNNI
mgnify:CR=1 FL=1